MSFQAIEQDAARGRLVLAGRPEYLALLENRGKERALIYKTLLMTGLRKGELASITIGQIDLQGPRPSITLDAADEKNRHGSTIPLRKDLAAELLEYLHDHFPEIACGQGEACRLDASVLALPLFRVPSGLARILNRDLIAAGIPKRDTRDRVVDVHALRHTFGSHLARAGVPLRTAQAAMRHSDPRLTANVYTDPALIDVSAAVESLPAFDAGQPARAGKLGEQRAAG